MTATINPSTGTTGADASDTTDTTDTTDLTGLPEQAPGSDVHALPGGALAAIEAVLMVADEPITDVQLATALALPVQEVRVHLRDLADEYRGLTGGRPRGFDLREAGGGWRIYSGAEYADVVGRFVLDGQTARLTQAALETLAVIAYRQPVTRGQVSGVRGVNVDGVVRTLTTRGLVGEVGTEPSSGAILYGTTPYFLERMGFSSLDQLPPLAPYLPDIEGLEGVAGLDGLGKLDSHANERGPGAAAQTSYEEQQ